MLEEKHGQRERLFSGGTAGAPNPDGAQAASVPCQVLPDGQYSVFEEIKVLFLAKKIEK